MFFYKRTTHTGMQVKKCFVQVGVKSHGVDVQRGTEARQQ